MRIPAEALPLFLNESDRLADAQGSPPVDASAKLASDLPRGFPKPRQAIDAFPEHSEGVVRDQRDGLDQERRHSDRRKMALPVTLDTRLTRSRRKSASPISIAI